MEQCREVNFLYAAPLAQGPVASLDLISANANAAASKPVERIRVLDERGDLLGADYTDHHGMAQLVRIEASTGRIVETIERMPMVPGHGTVWRWVYTLHHSFLAGDRGEVLVGFSGLFLISTIAMGLWIGWPPARVWRSAFDVARWRTLSQKLYGWHRALGLTVGLLLILIPLSGFYMIFEPEVRAVLAQVTPHHLKYNAAPVQALPPIRVSPQQAWDIAQRQFPEARFESLALPSLSAPVYIARLTQPEEPRVWAGVTYVAVNPTNGGVLDAYDAVHAPLSNRIGDAAFPLHNGEIAGLPGRLLVVLLGLSLPLFACTGIWGWWRKSRHQRVTATADRGKPASWRAADG
jgi:uncharacterized iron-regulated membrane protein